MYGDVGVPKEFMNKVNMLQWFWVCASPAYRVSHLAQFGIYTGAPDMEEIMLLWPIFLKLQF